MKIEMMSDVNATQQRDTFRFVCKQILFQTNVASKP